MLRIEPRRYVEGGGVGLNEQQIAALTSLREALHVATDSGLFDEMWAVTDPDVINSFCDAVTDLFESVGGS